VEVAADDDAVVFPVAGTLEGEDPEVPVAGGQPSLRGEAHFRVSGRNVPRLTSGQVQQSLLDCQRQPRG
jgi:hypothetical protein